MNFNGQNWPPGSFYQVPDLQNNIIPGGTGTSHSSIRPSFPFYMPQLLGNASSPANVNNIRLPNTHESGSPNRLQLYPRIPVMAVAPIQSHNNSRELDQNRPASVESKKDKTPPSHSPSYQNLTPGHLLGVTRQTSPYASFQDHQTQQPSQAVLHPLLSLASLRERTPQVTGHPGLNSQSMLQDISSSSLRQSPLPAQHPPAPNYHSPPPALLRMSSPYQPGLSYNSTPPTLSGSSAKRQPSPSYQSPPPMQHAAHTLVMSQLAFRDPQTQAQTPGYQNLSLSQQVASFLQQDKPQQQPLPAHQNPSPRALPQPLPAHQQAPTTANFHKALQAQQQKQQQELQQQQHAQQQQISQNLGRMQLPNFDKLDLDMTLGQYRSRNPTVTSTNTFKLATSTPIYTSASVPRFSNSQQQHQLQQLQQQQQHPIIRPLLNLASIKNEKLEESRPNPTGMPTSRPRAPKAQPSLKLPTAVSKSPQLPVRLPQEPVIRPILHPAKVKQEQHSQGYGEASTTLGNSGMPALSTASRGVTKSTTQGHKTPASSSAQKPPSSVEYPTIHPLLPLSAIKKEAHEQQVQLSQAARFSSPPMPKTFNTPPPPPPLVRQPLILPKPTSNMVTQPSAASSQYPIIRPLLSPAAIKKEKLEETLKSSATNLQPQSSYSRSVASSLPAFTSRASSTVLATAAVTTALSSRAAPARNQEPQIFPLLHPSAIKKERHEAEIALTSMTSSSTVSTASPMSSTSSTTIPQVVLSKPTSGSSLPVSTPVSSAYPAIQPILNMKQEHIAEQRTASQSSNLTALQSTRATASNCSSSLSVSSPIPARTVSSTQCVSSAPFLIIRPIANIKQEYLAERSSISTTPVTTLPSAISNVSAKEAPVVSSAQYPAINPILNTQQEYLAEHNATKSLSSALGPAMPVRTSNVPSSSTPQMNHPVSTPSSGALQYPTIQPILNIKQEYLAEKAQASNQSPPVSSANTSTKIASNASLSSAGLQPASKTVMLPPTCMHPNINPILPASSIKQEYVSARGGATGVSLTSACATLAPPLQTGVRQLLVAPAGTFTPSQVPQTAPRGRGRRPQSDMMPPPGPQSGHFTAPGPRMAFPTPLTEHRPPMYSPARLTGPSTLSGIDGGPASVTSIPGAENWDMPKIDAYCSLTMKKQSLFKLLEMLDNGSLKDYMYTSLIPNSYDYHRAEMVWKVAQKYKVTGIHVGISDVFYDSLVSPYITNHEVLQLKEKMAEALKIKSKFNLAFNVASSSSEKTIETVPLASGVKGLGTKTAIKVGSAQNTMKGWQTEKVVSINEKYLEELMEGDKAKRSAGEADMIRKAFLLNPDGQSTSGVPGTSNQTGLTHSMQTGIPQTAPNTNLLLQLRNDPQVDLLKNKTADKVLGKTAPTKVQYQSPNFNSMPKAGSNPTAQKQATQRKLRKVKYLNGAFIDLTAGSDNIKTSSKYSKHEVKGMLAEKVKSSQNSDNTVEAIKPAVQCYLCDNGGDTESEIRTHLIDSHIGRDKANVQSGKFTCTHCSQEFVSYTAVKTHEFSTHMMQSSCFFCGLCMDSDCSDNDTAFWRHVIKKHCQLFVCGVCQGNFVTEELFHAHCKEAAHERPAGDGIQQLFLCPYCNLKYISARTIRQHMIGSHTRDQELCNSCEKCRKRFIDNTALGFHASSDCMLEEKAPAVNTVSLVNLAQNILSLRHASKQIGTIDSSMKHLGKMETVDKSMKKTIKAGGKIPARNIRHSVNVGDSTVSYLVRDLCKFCQIDDHEIPDDTLVTVTNNLTRLAMEEYSRLGMQLPYKRARINKLCMYISRTPVFNAFLKTHSVEPFTVSDTVLAVIKEIRGIVKSLGKPLAFGDTDRNLRTVKQDFVNIQPVTSKPDSEQITASSEPTQSVGGVAEVTSPEQPVVPVLPVVNPMQGTILPQVGSTVFTPAPVLQVATFPLLSTVPVLSPVLPLVNNPVLPTTLMVAVSSQQNTAQTTSTQNITARKTGKKKRGRPKKSQDMPIRHILPKPVVTGQVDGGMPTSITLPTRERDRNSQSSDRSDDTIPGGLDAESGQKEINTTMENTTYDSNKTNSMFSGPLFQPDLVPHGPENRPSPTPGCSTWDSNQDSKSGKRTYAMFDDLWLESSEEDEYEDPEDSVYRPNFKVSNRAGSQVRHSQRRRSRGSGIVIRSDPRAGRDQNDTTASGLNTDEDNNEDGHDDSDSNIVDKNMSGSLDKVQEMDPSKENIGKLNEDNVSEMVDIPLSNNTVHDLETENTGEQNDTEKENKSSDKVAVRSDDGTVATLNEDQMYGNMDNSNDAKKTPKKRGRKRKIVETMPSDNYCSEQENSGENLLEDGKDNSFRKRQKVEALNNKQTEEMIEPLTTLEETVENTEAVTKALTKRRDRKSSQNLDESQNSAPKKRKRSKGENTRKNSKDVVSVKETSHGVLSGTIFDDSGKKLIENKDKLTVTTIKVSSFPAKTKGFSYSRRKQWCIKEKKRIISEAFALQSERLCKKVLQNYKHIHLYTDERIKCCFVKLEHVPPEVTIEAKSGPKYDATLLENPDKQNEDSSQTEQHKANDIMIENSASNDGEMHLSRTNRRQASPKGKKSMGDKTKGSITEIQENEKDMDCGKESKANDIAKDSKKKSSKHEKGKQRKIEQKQKTEASKVDTEQNDNDMVVSSKTAGDNDEISMDIATDSKPNENNKTKNATQSVSVGSSKTSGISNNNPEEELVGTKKNPNRINVTRQKDLEKAQDKNEPKETKTKGKKDIQGHSKKPEEKCKKADSKRDNLGGFIADTSETDTEISIPDTDTVVMSNADTRQKYEEISKIEARILVSAVDIGEMEKDKEKIIKKNVPNVDYILNDESKEKSISECSEKEPRKSEMVEKDSLVDPNGKKKGKPATKLSELGLQTSTNLSNFLKKKVFPRLNKDGARSNESSSDEEKVQNPPIASKAQGQRSPGTRRPAAQTQSPNLLIDNSNMVKRRSQQETTHLRSGTRAESPSLGRTLQSSAVRSCDDASCQVIKSTVSYLGAPLNITVSSPETEHQISSNPASCDNDKNISVAQNDHEPLLTEEDPIKPVLSLPEPEEKRESTLPEKPMPKLSPVYPQRSGSTSTAQRTSVSNRKSSSPAGRTIPLHPKMQNRGGTQGYYRQMNYDRTSGPVGVMKF